jgi:hypothetical protein
MSGLARSGGLRGIEWWLRVAVTSGRAYVRRDFHGHEVDHLYAPRLLHAGLSPDHAGGGLMMPSFAGTLPGFGLPRTVSTAISRNFLEVSDTSATRNP